MALDPKILFDKFWEKNSIILSNTVFFYFFKKFTVKYKNNYFILINYFIKLFIFIKKFTLSIEKEVIKIFPLSSNRLVPYPRQ